jgi:hypothetical protein
MFSDAISSISSRWRPSSRRIASATSGSVSASEAVKRESATAFAELSVTDIGFSRDGLAYHIARNAPRVGWQPHTARKMLMYRLFGIIGLSPHPRAAKSQRFAVPWV